MAAPHLLGPEKHVEALPEKIFIVPYNGDWSSPMVLVCKKDGIWRLCIDYRQLCDVIVQDVYLLSYIDESLYALVGSHCCSTLKLVSG